MTVAVITLAIALAGAVAAVVYLLRRQQSNLDAVVTAGKAQVAAEVAQREAERQRDEAIVARAKADAECADARGALADTQAALNKALEENAHETVEAIRSAPTAVDALDKLERLLQATARGEAVPGAATGDRDGDN